MHTRRAILGTALLTVLCAVTAHADTAAPSVQGPWLGVWKLNVEKSQFRTNKPPLGTVRTYTMTATGRDTFDVLILSTSPEGVQTMNMATKGARFDGKSYREIGNPFADANSFKLLSERSYEFVETKNGAHVITITVDISEDGRVRTSRQKSVGSDGKESVNVAVWERQD